MTSAATKLKEMKKQIADAKKAIKDQAKDLFKELTADLFSGNPSLVNFSWSQYTPYWCDGDVCEFGANTDSPTVRVKFDGQIVRYSDYETVIVDEDDVEFEVEAGKYEKECERICKAVSKILGQFDDEDFEMMFGDHVEVTVSPKKVTTDSYDHE
jgi:hypothetical protein